MAKRPYKVITIGTNEGTIDSMPKTHSAVIPIQPVVPMETDEEIIDRLRDRFNILEDMTKAVKRGDIKAMIVSGPPGVGKSFGVESVLSKHEFLADVAGDPSLKKFDIVKGQISAIGLFQKLFDFSDAKDVLVLDDCDALFYDDQCLNMLKAALDSSKKRTISWLTESRVLERENLPKQFEFKGGVIFITNIKFSDVRSKTLRDHLAALESRCHYVDLTIDTIREKMLRIKQITHDGMLDHYQFATETVNEVVQFVDDNKDKMRELSLRTVMKLADLRKCFPTRWESVAKVTLLK